MPLPINMPPASSFVDLTAEFSPAILNAARAWKEAKPWRGTVEQQHDKLASFHAALVEAGEIHASLAFTPAPAHFDGIALACYDPETDTLHVANQVSVVSFFFAVGQVVLGDNYAACMRFAVNLFRIVFPVSFARADLTGPMVKARS